MKALALEMLTGDPARYRGLLFGVGLAAFLITQQLAMLIGFLERTYSTITDMAAVNVWVMDPKVQYIDDAKPMQDGQLGRVRSIDGVAWAVPLYKGNLRVRLDNGNFQTAIVFGLDDSSLVGGPAEIVEGRLEDLRISEGVIVDQVGAATKLARRTAEGIIHPLRVGDTVELNDRRALVVGICKASRTFQSQPVLYTTYSRALQFAPQERKRLSFILAQSKQGQDNRQLCQRISRVTGLSAYTSDEFKAKTLRYFIFERGIVLVFGIGALVSFLIGTLIAGQTFYNFTIENLRHFGAFKAMGASNGMLIAMISAQAALVGGVGYGLGVGLVSVLAWITRNSEVVLRLVSPLLLFTGCAVALICVFAALFGVRKVIELDPAIVFRS